MILDHSHQLPKIHLHFHLQILILILLIYYLLFLIVVHFIIWVQLTLIVLHSYQHNSIYLFVFIILVLSTESKSPFISFQMFLIYFLFFPISFPPFFSSSNLSSIFLFILSLPFQSTLSLLIQSLFLSLILILLSQIETQLLYQTS